MLDPRLVEAISEEFDIPVKEVNAESSGQTIADWDSVGHLRLILRLEQTFHLRFPTSEIPKLVSAGLIQDALDRLQNGA
jgi:acyl carrier protein